MKKQEYKLYHKDVYMPNEMIECALNRQKNINVKACLMSSHLKKDHIDNVDKKHNYTAEDIEGTLNLIKARPVKPFEVGMSLDKTYMKKYAVRIKLDDEYDISIVINAKGTKIITAWVNNREDTHKTLDPTRYEQK